MRCKKYCVRERKRAAPTAVPGTHRAGACGAQVQHFASSAPATARGLCKRELGNSHRDSNNGCFQWGGRDKLIHLCLEGRELRRRSRGHKLAGHAWCLPRLAKWGARSFNRVHGGSEPGTDRRGMNGATRVPQVLSTHLTAGSGALSPNHCTAAGLRAYSAGTSSFDATARATYAVPGSATSFDATGGARALAT